MPATGSAAFARTNDKRAKTSGEAGCQDERWDHSSANIMSAPVESEPLASLKKQAAIRVEDVVGLAAPERPRHELDRPLAALDLDERADRRLVERDRGVLGGELLAELLIPEPHVQPQRLEHARQNVAVADDRLVFLASLHPARLHGPFERQQASAGFAADPQRASACDAAIRPRCRRAHLPGGGGT